MTNGQWQSDTPTYGFIEQNDSRVILELTISNLNSYEALTSFSFYAELQYNGISHASAINGRLFTDKSEAQNNTNKYIAQAQSNLSTPPGDWNDREFTLDFTNLKITNNTVIYLLLWLEQQSTYIIYTQSGDYPIRISNIIAKSQGVINVYTNLGWKTAIPYVYTNGKWEQTIPYIYTKTSTDTTSQWHICG